MFALSHQKASTGAAPMHYASAYAPSIDPHACPADPAECPLPADDVMDGPFCEDSGRQRDIENLQADMQKHVNDIKGAHLRWLPGRFRRARRGMLEVACVSGEDGLPARDVIAPVWPPVPCSRDVGKQRRYLDIHGHVLALKLWVKAVLFAVRYDKAMAPRQKQDLCRATEDAADQALHACKDVSWYDRRRLSAAQKHVARVRAHLPR